MQVRNALKDPLKAEEHCEQVDLSIDRAMKELRSLTYLLHPQSLFEGGLKTTIERFAEGFAARTSLNGRGFDIAAVDGLSREKQRSLMRIVQEALTNVYRHAKATRSTSRLRRATKHSGSKIRDDGQGMVAGNRQVASARQCLERDCASCAIDWTRWGGSCRYYRRRQQRAEEPPCVRPFHALLRSSEIGRRCAIKKSC